MGRFRVPGPFGRGAGGLHGRLARAARSVRTVGPSLVAPPAEPSPAEAAQAGASAPPFSPPAVMALPTPLTPEILANTYRLMTVTYRDPTSGAIRQADCSPCTYVNLAHDDRTPHPRAAHILLTHAERAAQGRRPVITLQPRFRPAILRAFRAIGTPSDMAFTLSIALSTGVTSPTTVDRYCHDLTIAGLGLHCTGFVMVYFTLRHGFRPASAINNYRVEALRRRTVAEIQPDDVLVWEGDDGEMVDHIAVVSSRIDDTRLRVGESTGSFGGPARYYGRRGGVSISTYAFEPPGRTGAFPVRRNLDGDATTSLVSVYQVARPDPA